MGVWWPEDRVTRSRWRRRPLPTKAVASVFGVLHDSGRQRHPVRESDGRTLTTEPCIPNSTPRSVCLLSARGRTRMDGGSGYTTWTYDDRGQVTEETKVINGAGTFKTQWSYDAIDRVVSMTYPGGSGGQLGEQVSYTYNAQGLFYSLSGSSTYVQSTSYDAPGRVELRVLGNDVLRWDPVYYPWTTANGRDCLQQLKAGTPSNPTSLQDLRYTYDAVGNVTRIEDWKAGSLQSHSFSYDDLDRLTYAGVSGGSGGLYSEGVSYYPDGNINAKGGLDYTYDPNHRHAVQKVVEPMFGSTVHSYTYDANGNMTGRDGDSLTYDAENRLVGVSGAANRPLSR